ncbi:MAG: hypothetical protein ACRDJH_23870 [Thermomicrobiales bacterium]
MATARPLGVVLTSAEVQYEGLDPVLDNIQRAGATAISPTLGVMARAQPGEGTREPPGDVDGHARLLDRPLWGERELWIRYYSPHEADPAIWADVPFPSPPVAPPDVREDIPRRIIDGARRRGLKVEVQISPYILPGAPGGQSVGSARGTGNAADRPRRVDGSVGERVVAGHGCLNNPGVRVLGRARMREAIKHYGDVDGVFVDWVEYTTYFLEDCFVCFCDHCRAAAEAAGYDWAAMERDTLAVWDRLHRLTPADLRRASDAADWPFVVGDGAVRASGFGELLRFKAATARAAVAELRQVMDAAGATGVGLGVNGFAPPWSRITGMDYREVSRVCQETRCKLFTFHWPMMTRWWGETLLAWNPGLDEIEVLRAVTAALDLLAPAQEHRRTLTAYGMPRPDEPHPITPEALTRKVNQAVALAGDGAPCLAYAHSYRPVDEFERHLEAVLASNAPGCWVQRYGYLSDEKLEVMRRVWR